MEKEGTNKKIIIGIIVLIIIGGIVFYVKSANKTHEYPNATIEEMTQAYEADPNDHEKLFHLTLEYYKINDFEKTEELYKKLIALKPSYTLYRKNYAKMLINLERYEEAMEEFGEVLVINEFDTEVLHNIMNAYTDIEESRQYIDLDKMIDLLLEIEEANLSQTQYQSSISSLARGYLLKGDYDKAIEYYEKKNELGIGDYESNKNEIERIKELKNS